jgi:chemotaxis protein MotA
MLVGLLIGFGGVVYGYMFDGGTLMSLLKPSSASIVFGGTIGIALISFPLDSIKKIPKAMKSVISGKKHDYEATVETLYNLANIARREGILSLETEAEKTNDDFIKKGLTYIVDGVEPDFLEKILVSEIGTRNKELEEAAAVFESMGGSAPTMGVLGTVMGMVSILREMGGDMNELGAKIATAFIATMYGVGSANLLWLPFASHIKKVAEEESEYLHVVMDGLLSIQAGEYPARLKESLISQIGELKYKGKGADKEVGKKSRRPQTETE